MKRTLTTLLILTLMVGSLADFLATPVAARVYSVQPTNEDSGPPTDQFTTADPIFAIFRSNIEGGEICVIDADGSESHCKTVISDSSLTWTLIAPGLPPGTYRLRASDNDPDYSLLSFPFTVAPCDLANPACSAQRRLSDEVVAEWKEKAGVSLSGFGQMCSSLAIASTFKKQKIGRGFHLAKKAVDDWGWEAGLVVVGIGYGLGFVIAYGGVPTAAYKPFLALVEELSCGAQQMYADIKADPPDPDYTTVVPPAFTTLPITGDATTDRLALTLDRKRAFGRAQLKAYERYLGAVEAGDENAVRLQAQAIADYGQALVAEMRESAAALRTWGAAQAADPDVDNPAITQADLDTAAIVFERVRTSGFTEDEINQLTAAGLSQGEIDQIRASYNRDLDRARVGVSVKTIADDAAAALEASISAFNTFSQEAAWVADARAPKTVSLAPLSASRSVGTTHTVSASVANARNAPVAGVSVTLNVTGAHPATLTAVTNAGGVATFSYVGNNAGVDNLSATAGTATSNNATVSWSIGPPNAVPSVRVYNESPEEGSNGQFQFDFTDADTQDTHTATIDWGDGSPLDTYPNANGNAGFIIDNKSSGFIIGYHRYAESGVYSATATVTDNRGGAGTGVSTVTVRNITPVLGSVTLEEVNGEIVLNADFTDRSLNNTHTAVLNWGDGTIVAGVVTEAGGAGTVTGSHVYGGPGNYTLTLTLSDNKGGTTFRNINLTVGNDGLGNSPPSMQLSNYLTFEGGGSFGAEFTDPDTLDVHTATIDWGDGSPVQPLSVRQNNGSGSIFGNHVYVDNGNFNIRVTLADNHGGGVSGVAPMNVQNAEPRVGFIFPSSRLVTPGDTITVRADFNDYGVRDTHTAVWNWGDGTTTEADFTEANGSGQASGSHAYTTPGVYTISLRVTDNDGATGVGTTMEPVGVYAAKITEGSIKPVVTETGKISASMSGLGMRGQLGTLTVEKPTGATVRRAYMASASRGLFNYLLRPDDVKLAGVDVAWNIVTRSGIKSFNFWGEVTHIVKAKLDSAPAGRVDFSLREGIPTGVDSIEGEVLVVIFDDPNQTTDNTVALLFGAQQTSGDTFALRFAQPLNLSDPNFALTMSLGISYGYNDATGQQYSTIDVNGQRMTTSAGGQDDGEAANGALLTVGGLDDSPANPSDPYALPRQPRADDELYDLRPFVNTGDTELTVATSNPSNDDNIFFAAFFLQDTAVVVGEGVVLTPLSASHEVGTQHTLAATAQDAQGNLLQGRDVTFEILSGAHVGLNGTVATDAQGLAQFTYAGTLSGTDIIVARFVNSEGQTQTSNTVTVEWETKAIAPTRLTVSPASGPYGGTTELSAQLTAGGTPLDGRDVSFSLNGTTLGVAKTDDNGVATISNVSLAGINAGTHPNAVTASFAGDTSHAASSGTADLNVSKATLTVTAADASRKYGDPNPMFSGTITGIKNGDEITASYSTTATPASNVGAYDIVPTLADPTGKLSNYDVTQIKGTLAVSKAALSVVADDKSKVYGTVNPPLTVHYSGFVNGENASVLGGTLSLSTTAMTGSPIGSYSITAHGLTSPNYAVTYVEGTLMVTKAVLTITADNKSRIYNTVNPPLTFTLSGFVNGDTAATAFNGAPTVTTAAQTSSSVGAYPITAAIGTLSSANYSFTFVPGTLSINQAPTTTVTDGKMFANNSAGILTATLLDINSLPIVNRMLTLTLGTGPNAQTCSAMTDAAGRASCRINTVVQPLGPGTVSGSLAGDNNYLSSASDAQALIFDYPAGVAGGSFVIGDRNAVVGKQVTFWGAQWVNLNSLSGGVAPSSFKGFANLTSTNPATCGGKWTTSPGNSSGPPSSIPTYMAVIVSSSITKSGSTITGNAPQIVVVKTDPGYDSNPGHAGTGTVVAVWCN